jgi:hypothetical protein
MARPSALLMERLEERTVPAVFGVPWTDARHLTLSFVPNGTDVDGVSSTLFGMTGSTSAAATQAWEAEILRAVQTWAQYANINVDVVTDSGDPLGTDGANQGDPRFGDIRIAARPLSGNVLAITTPSGPLGGTRAGDIVLNTDAHFSIGGANGTTDLYSAVLQEVGHALGMSNSTDIRSPMYETYQGVRTGLTAGDVKNIQTLYGTRADDGFETNNTLAAAKEVKAPAGSPANASPVVLADITTPQDVDDFKFKTPAAAGPLTVRVDASSSLLAARLTVYDNLGNVVGTTVGTTQGGPIQVTLTAARANVYYTAKVEAANPAFAVGGYQLKFVTDPNAPDVMAYGSQALLNDAHTDDTLAAATRLDTADGYANKTHYTVLARVLDATDVDVYRIDTPNASHNQQLVLTVNVRAMDPTALAPTVQVFDKSGLAVAAQVLNNGNGTYTVQVADADKNSRYFVRVAAANAGGTGDYQLDADVRSQAVNVQSLAAGTLYAATGVDFTTLTTGRSEVMYFELSAGGLPAGAQGGVRMAIFDANGHAVATLFANAGQTASMNTFLAAGTYTIRFETVAPPGTVLPAMTYGLKGVNLTDPIATVSSDPSLSTTSTDYTFVKFSLSVYVSQTFDLLDEMIW